MQIKEIEVMGGKDHFEEQLQLTSEVLSLGKTEDVLGHGRAACLD